MSERDPLLQHTNGLGQEYQQLQGEEGCRQKGVNRALGPLEISRSTRYGILAGLWMATFLSVSCPLLNLIQLSTAQLFIQALNRKYCT